MLRIGLGAAAALFITVEANAETPALAAEMAFTSAAPRLGVAGTIRVSPSPAGAVFTVDLADIAPGFHGMHVHENRSCADTRDAGGESIAAGAAGPHWDPHAAGAHRGPHGDGHLADLPRIEAGRDGRAVGSFVAPRIKDVEALKGRAVIVHVGADTYSDQPNPLGGGGKRLACGVLGRGPG